MRSDLIILDEANWATATARTIKAVEEPLCIRIDGMPVETSLKSSDKQRGEPLSNAQHSG